MPSLLNIEANTGDGQSSVFFYFQPKSCCRRHMSVCRNDLCFVTKTDVPKWNIRVSLHVSGLLTFVLRDTENSLQWEQTNLWAIQVDTNDFLHWIPPAAEHLLKNKSFLRTIWRGRAEGAVRTDKLTPFSLCVCLFLWFMALGSVDFPLLKCICHFCRVSLHILFSQTLYLVICFI